MRRSLRSRLGGLDLVELTLGCLDQAHHVAHAEDPLSHAIGMEALELIKLLACGGKHDRLARDRLDRQRSATARVTVELAHHDPIELNSRGELLGDVDRVLAGHRVNDEQHVVRPHGIADLHKLGHQRLVHMHASACVDDQHVLALFARTAQCPCGYLDRIAVRVGGLGNRRRRPPARQPS